VATGIEQNFSVNDVLEPAVSAGVLQYSDLGFVPEGSAAAMHKRF